MTDPTPDPQYAALIEQLAIRALCEGEHVVADYLLDVADQWDEPTEAVLVLRLQILNRTMNAQPPMEHAT